MNEGRMLGHFFERTTTAVNDQTRCSRNFCRPFFQVGKTLRCRSGAMECSSRYMTASEKRAEPDIDDGGRRRSVLFPEFTGKIGRLDGLRRSPWIRRWLFLSSDGWNRDQGTGCSKQNSNAAWRRFVSGAKELLKRRLDSWTSGFVDFKEIAAYFLSSARVRW